MEVFDCTRCGKVSPEVIRTWDETEAIMHFCSWKCFQKFWKVYSLEHGRIQVTITHFE